MRILFAGFSIWHFVLDIIAVYIFLITLGPTLITLTLTWILTMVCYSSCHDLKSTCYCSFCNQHKFILLHELEGNKGKYSARGMSVLARPEGGTIHNPESWIFPHIPDHIASAAIIYLLYVKGQYDNTEVLCKKLGTKRLFHLFAWFLSVQSTSCLQNCTGLYCLVKACRLNHR